MRLNGMVFSETIVETNGDATWDIRIPISSEGYVHLRRCFGDCLGPTVVVPLANTLHRILSVDTLPEIALLPQAEPEPERRSRSAVVGA
jgi:hypothetical protein